MQTAEISLSLNVLLLFVALLIPLLVAWISRREMQRFRAENHQLRDLSATYRRWTRASFMAHFVIAILAMALLHRASAIVTFPPEFKTASLSGALLAGHDDVGLLGLSDIAVALLLGATVGLATITLALMLRQRRAPTQSVRVLGEVERLIPSSPKERFWWAVLSLNAGVSEELYYRLLLPLLLTSFIANALIAFVISAAAFGIGHIYQGARGAISAFLIGLLLGAFYLMTENLVLVMVVHVLIDLRLILLRRPPSLDQSSHS